MECPQGSPSTQLQETCGAAQAGQLNVMAVLDPADLPAP
jgi:hypothetical protein